MECKRNEESTDLIGSGVCVPHGTTPEQRFLERLTRRAGAGMTIPVFLDSSPSVQNDNEMRTHDTSALMVDKKVFLRE